MEVEELRIGNLVSDNGKVCTVDEIDFYGHVKTEDSKYDKGVRTITPEGIPLSEEWLLRSEFKKDEDYEGVFDALYENDLGYRVTVKNGLFQFWPRELHGFEVDLSNVHHFQNVYFALTGNELEIKKA